MIDHHLGTAGERIGQITPRNCDNTQWSTFSRGRCWELLMARRGEGYRSSLTRDSQFIPHPVDSAQPCWTNGGEQEADPVTQPNFH
jgi:hypothetical protein